MAQITSAIRLLASAERMKNTLIKVLGNVKLDKALTKQCKEDIKEYKTVMRDRGFL
jgi:hypothetical protein